jgi:hypothetical protein
MFNINTLPRVTVPVPLFVEVDGKRQNHSFSATFEMIDPEAEGINPAEGRGDRDLLERVVVGLGDIADNEGNVLPFSDELKHQVLARLDARAALVRAFYGEVPKLIRGN